MNRLLFPNGGVPLHGDDFIFLQDAFKEGLKGVIELFAKPHNGNMILSGCDINLNAGIVTVTSGFILINYEVLFVPGNTVINSDLSNVSLNLDSSFDINGFDIFEDGQSRDTYELRRGIASNLIGSNEIILDNPPRLNAELISIIEQDKLESNIPIFSNGWSIFPGSQAKVIQFLKHYTLTGRISNGIADNSTAFVLSNKPPVDSTFIVPMSISPFFARLTVNATTGAASILAEGNPSLTSNDFVSLDGIQFFSS